MKDELDFFGNYGKEKFKKVIINEFKSYKYKRTRELLIAWIFVVLILVFSNPVIAFNINLLNTIGYTLYLPIFTISTVVLPILVGRGIEQLINHKNNNKHGIFNKINDEVLYESNHKFSEVLAKNISDIFDNKETVFSPSINNLTRDELLNEINKIITKEVVKENKGKLKSIDSFYLFSVIMLSALPIFLYAPIFSTIGLDVLNNTFILKLIFLLMGIGISVTEASRYNNDLEDAISDINKLIGESSNFDKEDLNTLLKAYQIKIYNQISEENNKEIKKYNKDNKKDKKEITILDKKPIFQKIPPKIIEYEFKGNPEEKRNNKVLVRGR